MKNTFIRNFSLTCIALLLATACGKSGNMFEKVYKPTSKEKAQQYLESGDCDSAQTELAAYLEDSPSDTEAKQLYYDAVSTCLDLGMDSLISKLGDTSAVEGGDFSKLTQLMPEATQENIDKLQKAVDALQSIPADQRTSEQNAQLAIAAMSVAVTTAKMVAVNDDGSYSPEKAAEMTEEQAAAVLSNLEVASGALTASGGNSEQTQAISKVSTDINSTPGSTSREKLQQYLQAR